MEKVTHEAVGRTSGGRSGEGVVERSARAEESATQWRRRDARNDSEKKHQLNTDLVSPC